MSISVLSEQLTAVAKSVWLPVVTIVYHCDVTIVDVVDVTFDRIKTSRADNR